MPQLADVSSDAVLKVAFYWNENVISKSVCWGNLILIRVNSHTRKIMLVRLLFIFVTLLSLSCFFPLCDLFKKMVLGNSLPARVGLQKIDSRQCNWLRNYTNVFPYGTTLTSWTFQQTHISILNTENFKPIYKDNLLTKHVLIISHTINMSFSYR